MTKILVIGDGFLDTYLYGKSYRDNPEGAAPLIKIEKVVHQLGGCYNVASNIAQLGSKVTVCSRLGDDLKSEKIIESLQQKNIDFRLGSRYGETIEKVRVYDEDNYITRYDIEEIPHLNTEEELIDSLKISSEIEERIKEFSCIVISNYNKGFITEFICTQIIDIARENGSYVICDPKGAGVDMYYGANLLSPNIKELRELSREEDLDKGATTLLEYVENVLCTKSEQGFSLYNKNGRKDWPALNKSPHSVTGSGDLLVGGLAHFIGEGKTLEEALDIVNPLLGEALNQSGTVHF